MLRFLFLISAFIFLSLSLQAQEETYEDMLREKVIIDDPIYKPVIGFGTGLINFHGDVRNNVFNPVIGDNAFKFNVSTFIDPGRYFKINFFLIYGAMTGIARSVGDPESNLNFKTDLVSFGINAEYSARPVKSTWPEYQE